MIEPLRPHVAIASSYIHDVAALAGGGYAVLTDAGIELFDASLARRGAITGERAGTVLVALPGERFLVHGTWPSRLHEGAVGGALAKVDLGTGMVSSVAVTETGFLAIATDHVLVDHAGARTVVTPSGCIDFGGTPWRGGAAVAGYEGLVILGADGAIVARSAGAQPWKRPVALADALAVPGYDDVMVLDGAAQVIARIPRKVAEGALVPFRGGVLVTVHDEDARETEVSYWEVATGAAAASAAPAPAPAPALAPRWTVTRAGHLRPASVAGDRVVLASYEAGAWILDGEGGELAALTTAKPVHAVAAFGGGIALGELDAPDVLWWRPGAELARLPHDVWPSRVRAVPAGLATVEGKVLYVWRTDAQGPEVAPIEHDLPMHTPIVIGGTPLQITSAGRFALRAVTLDGRAASIHPGVPWRPLTTRDEASRLLERLVARVFDGPLPAVPGDGLVYELAATLGQLPPSATVDLHGRALFAASSLDPQVRVRSTWGRSAFFDELGAALGMSGRALLAAVKARKRKLEPPRPVPGYEYLGTFTTSGQLTVSDPCYVGKKAPAGIAISLSLKVEGHAGVWHVFLRGGTGQARDRTAELVTIHDDGFDVYATEALGLIAVDSGTAGVFDKKCPRRDGDTPPEEGTFAALGALASTGYGDGMYPVFAGNRNGVVAKLRLCFLGDDAAVDRSVARAAAAAKPYRASARFAAGDTIEHVKFGTGTVIRAGSDGKIDVQFAAGTRTLVHAKK